MNEYCYDYIENIEFEIDLDGVLYEVKGRCSIECYQPRVSAMKVNNLQYRVRSVRHGHFVSLGKYDSKIIEDEIMDDCRTLVVRDLKEKGYEARY